MRKIQNNYKNCKINYVIGNFNRPIILKFITRENQTLKCVQLFYFNNAEMENGTPHQGIEPWSPA